MARRYLIAAGAVLGVGIFGSGFVPAAGPAHDAFGIAIVVLGVGILGAMFWGAGGAINAAGAAAQAVGDEPQIAGGVECNPPTVGEPLPPTPPVLRTGPANLKVGWNMKGGVLKLTEERLIFASHGFAQRAAVTSWSLAELDGISSARALGLVPNALQLRFGGAEIKLVVTERDVWMHEIRDAAAKLRR